MERWKTVLFSRTLLYPVIAMAILRAGSAWYSGVAVRQREPAVNERSLRALAAIADEFSSRLATLDNIGHRPWKATELRGQVPELKEEKCDVDAALVPVSHYKLLIVVEATSGVTSSCWSISFESLMRSLQDSLPKGIFEDLLL